MKFTPKTQEQLDEEGLLPEGRYDFEVMSGNDKPAKSGDEMMTLYLQVWDANGDSHTVKDFLKPTNLKKMLAFCKCVGLEKEYESGDISSVDCLNKSGVAFIKPDKGNADFPPANRVLYYVPSDEAKGTTKTKLDPVAKQEEFKDDDLPF